MQILQHPATPLAVALGIGLLIGAERERRKGEGRGREAAGIRTFAITALLGAACMEIANPLLLSVVTAGLLGLTALAYFRSTGDDPGLTTEVALIMTLILGALACSDLRSISGTDDLPLLPAPNTSAAPACS
jgi:MgtC family